MFRIMYSADDGLYMGRN